MLIQAFNGSSHAYQGFTYSALGNNIGEAAIFMVRHPLKAIELLFVNHSGNVANNNIKAEFYIVTLLSGGILLFRKPLFLLMFIPIIAQKMYNDSPMRWGINSFYSIEVVSLLSICVFVAIASFENKKFRTLLVSFTIVSTLCITIVKLRSRTASDYYPQKENILSSQFYTPPCDLNDVKKGLLFIPDDASVAASERLVPHLAFRSEIHCFPFVHNSKYIALLKNVSHYPLSAKEFEEQMIDLQSNSEWETIYDSKEMVVLRFRGDSVVSRQ